MDKFKKTFYLILAHYFAFWAKIVLKRWQPEVVLVTGSSGKTTAFELLAAQLGEKAALGRRANSAYGIPFFILGLQRQTYSLTEWVKFFVLAPLKSLTTRPTQKFFLVEADAERPGEAQFIQKLLRPTRVVITNVHQTHACYFDPLVQSGQYERVIDAIADEFALYARDADQQLIVNGDSASLMAALERATLRDEVRRHLMVVREKEYLGDYQITREGTRFEIGGNAYVLGCFLPREVAFSLRAVELVMADLGWPLDPSYRRFCPPPGRGTLLAGINDLILVDSTYNANLGSMKAILGAFERFPAPQEKWVVLGECRELGEQSRDQHRRLAEYVVTLQTISQVVLVSPELRKWTYPLLLEAWGSERVRAFETVREAYVWLRENLRGGETVLFKASNGRHLEAAVEGLLADPADAAKLPSRAAIYRPVQEEVLRAWPKSVE